MLHLRDFIPHTPQHFTFYHNKKLFKCLLNSTLNVKFKITFYYSSFERIIIFEKRFHVFYMVFIFCKFD